MASDRNFIIKMSNTSANKVVAYEGVSGDVPVPLQGEFTNEALARKAIQKYLLEVKPTSKQEIKVEVPAPSGESSGNAKRKQRV